VTTRALQDALRALWPDRPKVYLQEGQGDDAPVLTDEERGLLSRVADALDAADRRGAQEAVVFLHADRVTTEPTTFTAERDAQLAPGEVCMSLRPFPSTNDSAEVVLYGSPEQLRDLFDSCGSFVEDVTP
jgi:hypothetical protein